MKCKTAVPRTDLRKRKTFVQYLPVQLKVAFWKAYAALRLYKNYAPQQFALLENCIIDSNGNTLFYCTSKNAEKYYKEFKSNL